MKEMEILGDERGNISLAKYNYKRDILFLGLHISQKQGEKRQFMDGEKEAEISCSEKLMISSEMSSEWSSVVSLGPEVP